MIWPWNQIGLKYLRNVRSCKNGRENLPVEEKLLYDWLRPARLFGICTLFYRLFKGIFKSSTLMFKIWATSFLSNRNRKICRVKYHFTSLKNNDYLVQFGEYGLSDRWMNSFLELESWEKNHESYSDFCQTRHIMRKLS